MIKEIFCEPDHVKNYENLSNDRKKHYQEIYNRLTCCFEEYSIAIDLPSEFSEDYGVITTMQVVNGKLKIINVECI